MVLETGESGLIERGVRTGAHERARLNGPSGRYDRAAPRSLPARVHRPRPREDARGVPTHPTASIPGRSLVTRRALTDIVRAATLGSYGVTGFAGGTGQFTVEYQN